VKLGDLIGDDVEMGEERRGGLVEVKDAGFDGLAGLADAVAVRRMGVEEAGPGQAEGILDSIAQRRLDLGLLPHEEQWEIVRQTFAQVPPAFLRPFLFLFVGFASFCDPTPPSKTAKEALPSSKIAPSPSPAGPNPNAGLS
jgi:hypothetical protein